MRLCAINDIHWYWCASCIVDNISTSTGYWYHFLPGNTPYVPAEDVYSIFAYMCKGF